MKKINFWGLALGLDVGDVFKGTTNIVLMGMELVHICPSWTDILKAAGHKYKMRMASKSPPPKYRYFYNVPGKGIIHHDSLKIGSSFAHGEGEKKGHYHITRVGANGIISIWHDETKDVRHITKEQLKDLLYESTLGAASKEKGKALLERYKAALQHGTSYHKEQRLNDLHQHIEAHGDNGLKEGIKEAHEEHKKAKAAPLKTGDSKLDSLEEKAAKEKLSKDEIDTLSQTRKRPLSPNVSVALSPDKKASFHTRHKVVDLFDLVTSHDMNGKLRDDYDQALQSRHRGSLADKEQIRTMASSLEPMALLYDSRRTDEGSPIIGADGMVESGNGRTLAMMWAAKGNNEAWKEYQNEIGNYLPALGISPSELKGKKFPVVVRERVTGDGNTDFRVSFAEKANTSSIKRMSSFEEAQRDGGRITPKMMMELKFGEDESIESALSRAANKHIAGNYLESMSRNESAALMDEHGDLSKYGRERFKAAMYLYAMPGKAGETIARTFVESSDHDLRNFDQAFSKALPSLAQTRALFNTGERDPKLDVMPDLARAIQVLDDLKRKDMTVKEYLPQQELFSKERMTTPLQEKMFVKIDEIKRTPKRLKELLLAYVETIQEQPDARPEDRKGENLDLLATMLGEKFAKPKKKGFGSVEEVWEATMQKFEAKQAPKAQASLF